VYFYQSYRKNKSGVPLILDHSVDTKNCLLTSFSVPFSELSLVGLALDVDY